MKKIFSMLLALITVFTVMSFQTFADNETERLLSLVKSRIGSTEEYNEFSSSVYDLAGEKSYYFSWTSGDENYKEMNVTVIPEGIITSYDIYDYYSSDEKIKKGTYDAALQRAKDLFFKINPALEKSYIISRRTDYESINEYQYSFDLYRVENGIKVGADNGYLNLSSDMTKITGFYFSYTPYAELKKPENIISKDEAKEAFSKNIGMTLAYRIRYNREGKKEAYLVYLPAKNNTYVDAFTGDIKHIKNEFYYNNSKAEARDELAGGASDESFSEAEEEDLVRLNSIMSEENAEKLLRQNKLFNITDDYDADWINLYKEHGSDKYLYQIDFSNIDEDSYASAVMNASTGEIIRFSHYDNQDEDSLSPKQKYEFAVKYARELAPSHVNEYVLEPDEDMEYDTYVFRRSVQSIPCVDDCISVSVSSADGHLNSYSISYSEIDFPDASKCISREEALSILYQKLGMDLIYIPSFIGDSTRREYHLIYTPDIQKTWSVDAVSGIIDDVSAEIPEYTDIAGHYGEAAIKDLKNYLIGCGSPEFMPNKPITQKEFLNLIINVISWGNPVLFDNTDGMDNYWIADILKGGENISDRSITRLEAVIYIIRALGIEEYASIQNIYISPFADVPADKAGFAAILYGMNVIKGTGNTFNPNGVLTRADAAIMVDNYINR